VEGWVAACSTYSVGGVIMHDDDDGDDDDAVYSITKKHCVQR